MKDFDEHIADQLDREGQFPNRGRNWRHLSKRLDALDMGGLNARPKLRVWQAVAAVAAVSSGLLLWVVFGQKQENAALRKEIAQLQQQLMQATPATKATEPPVHQDQAHVEPEQNSTNSSLNRPKADNLPFNNPAPSIAAEEVVKKIQTPNPAISIDAEGVTNPTQLISPAAQSATVAADGSTDLQQPDNFQNQAASSTADVAVDAQQPNPLQPAEPADLNPAEAPTVAVIEKPDSLLSPPAAPLLPAPVIDPVKKPLRFKVGPYAVLGFVQPRSKGVTAIKGQGVAAEFKLFKNWWLSASAEWLHYDVCSIEFPKKFYPPKDTIPKPPGPGPGGPGGPHSKLTMVESSQRMQQYGVGLRYEMPVRWWFRPAVRASYNWVRTAPTLITYQFEKDEPHGGGGGGYQKPEYAAEKVAAQWQQNQWEIGLGLEKDLPRWTFGLWADFAKSLSPTTPSFDALYVSGGVKYRF